MPVCCSQDGDGLKPLSFGYRLNGVSGSMAAHIGLATERGRPYALVTLAAAEAFPEGLLEGAVFHWGVTSREGGSWVAPPEGWQADPDRSMDAGKIRYDVQAHIPSIRVISCIT